MALTDATLSSAGIELVLWRLDRIPGPASGNKAFKLLPAIAEAHSRGAQGIASFGGAWSNHLHTLALAGKQSGLKTLGLVRGDAEVAPSVMLRDAMARGMEIQFLSRNDYRRRHDRKFLAELQAEYPDYYWVPEGGSDELGVQACTALGEMLDGRRLGRNDLVTVPCGTGGTLAGLVAGLPEHCQAEVVGYSALKGASFLESDVAAWQSRLKGVFRHWSIEHRFHGGGYGKCNEPLQDFILGFYQRHGIALDPVYNGKMLWGIYQQTAAAELKDRRIIALHTGGVQGLRGYPALFAKMTEMGLQSL